MAGSASAATATGRAHAVVALELRVRRQLRRERDDVTQACAMSPLNAPNTVRYGVSRVTGATVATKGRS